jgi:membrane-bound inhibitor of C-type lysozyme
MKLMSRPIRASYVFAPLLLTACMGSGIEVTDIPLQINYACSHNKTLSVTRSPDQRMASVLIEGKEIVLPRASSAAQEKYSDGNYNLYLDSEQAMLEQTGMVIFGPCRSQVALPTYYR